MSVRQLNRRHKPAARRRVHVAPPPEPGPEPMHPVERRMRDAGGPEDRAYYPCACGFVFVAAVSTSVQCPRCARGQAW